MKLLITGANGMLGQALCKELIGRYEVAGIVEDRAHINLESGVWGQESKELPLFECDIRDKERLSSIFKDVSPDFIIHTAAYTDVDGCEIDPQKAYSVNSLGTCNVASEARKAEAVLVYISTDYVFDGAKRTPYTESDKTCPINVYGNSKLEGERHVETALRNFFIFRTSWLFGKGGKNFVDTIINKAKSVKELKIVDDQRGSPTWTVDLASGIRRVMDFYSERGPIDNVYGIYHLTNSGSCSWYEFTKTILDYAGIRDVAVSPVTTQELNRPANRPAMSILDNTKYEKLVGTRLRPWQEALKDYLGLTVSTNKCPDVTSGVARDGEGDKGRMR
jgi:dTDP-4-dehydrorhamnose reductase